MFDSLVAAGPINIKKKKTIKVAVNFFFSQ